MSRKSHPFISDGCRAWSADNLVIERFHRRHLLCLLPPCELERDDGDEGDDELTVKSFPGPQTTMVG